MWTNGMRFVFLALTATAAACYAQEGPLPPAGSQPVAQTPAPPTPSPVPPPALAPPPVTPPSGPTPPAPPGATSLGCFKDQEDPTGTSGRDLNGFAEDVPGMTAEMCTEMCTSKGFSYAGTQYGTWCFCGTSYGKSGKADNCNMKCGGAGNEICGGSWANSVYQLKPAGGPSNPPSPDALHACAADSDCVAVGACGCCGQAHGQAVNASRAVDYGKSLHCPSQPPCVAACVTDMHAPECNAGTRSCEMVPIASIVCGLGAPHQCPGGYACRSNACVQ